MIHWTFLRNKKAKIGYENRISDICQRIIIFKF